MITMTPFAIASHKLEHVNINYSYDWVFVYN